MTRYKVKKIFLTLQGEGFHSGRRSIFVRFTGCNLWSGREADRAASCSAWCDTDFVGGDSLTAAEIAGRAASLWGDNRSNRWVVLTGGEPTLQVDSVLIDCLKRFGFSIQMETNGTRPVPSGLDWITVSPKAGSNLYIKKSDELKLVYPQESMEPDSLDWFIASRRFLQPLDGPNIKENTIKCTQYCLNNPAWSLSIQIHKTLGIE